MGWNFVIDGRIKISKIIYIHAGMDYIIYIICCSSGFNGNFVKIYYEKFNL